MIAHLIFWLAVRCAPRQVVDLQWRQRRAHSIVAGVMQFDFAAFSRHYNSGSALCGKTTRDYTFITACGTPPPPAVCRLWRRLNCFWLIKAPKCHSNASKPGANRLETPVNTPNSRLRHTLDAHFVHAAVSLRVQRRPQAVFCLNSRNYRRYAENRSQ